MVNNISKEQNHLTKEQKKMGWSVMPVWNETIKITKGRQAKVKDYIVPSDIGKDYWGRYQKMMGVEETNPFEDRVLRIFSAGDEFHHLMRNVFRACGIFINSQDDEGWSVIEPTATTLKILGKYDILAGGKPNKEQAERYCREWGLSDFVASRVLALTDKILELYPEGLPKMLYEIKSINSMAFWNKRDYLQEAYPWHRAQTWIYLKANNIEQGRLLYVSKDDLMVAEFPIYLNDKKLEAEVQKDLEEMTNFIKTKTEPPKPDDMVFNPRGKIRFTKNKKKHVIMGCYETNWEIERSLWFTKMTGYKKKEPWKKKVWEKVKAKNNEIKVKYIVEKGL